MYTRSQTRTCYIRVVVVVVAAAEPVKAEEQEKM